MEWYDLSDLLRGRVVTGSAPCRVDCGGSTDHRLTALLCRQWHPATTNIALELRSIIRLEPYMRGRIIVESVGFGQQEVVIPNITFQGPFGLVFAILAHFGVHGVRVIVESQSPPCSGLGASGAISVAIIGALSRMLSLLTNERYAPRKIVLLAHNIEDSLYSNTGLQDQAAAVYGGAHLWEWRYGSKLDFKQYKLQIDPTLLERHMLLAYTEKPHPTSQKGSAILDKIRCDGDTLNTLTEISHMARDFADAIQAGSYSQAGQILLAEMRLRSKLAPELLSHDHYLLLEIAEKLGCGAKTTGHGGGGCVWAIGPEMSILELKHQWQEMFRLHNIGFLLPVTVARSGLQVNLDDRLSRQSCEHPVYLDDLPPEIEGQNHLEQKRHSDDEKLGSCMNPHKALPRVEV